MSRIIQVEIEVNDNLMCDAPLAVSLLLDNDVNYRIDEGDDIGKAVVLDYRITGEVAFKLCDMPNGLKGRCGERGVTREDVLTVMGTDVIMTMCDGHLNEYLRDMAAHRCDQMPCVCVHHIIDPLQRMDTGDNRGF